MISSLLSNSSLALSYFLTPSREAFFRSLVDILVPENIFKMGILELDKQPIAVVIFFEYNEKVYLYNNGFEPDLRSLSIGVLSKVFSIKESINRGMKRYDFLKGNEKYKYHLGGQEVRLMKCELSLNRRKLVK